MDLIAKNLSCDRAGRQVFSHVSFKLSSGRALIVSGPNGVGKSSLLRLIAGLVAPSCGEVSLSGGDKERAVGEQAHYFGHLDALKPALSVRENLEFWTRLLAWDVSFHAQRSGFRPGVDEALARLQLDHAAELPAARLSAGQRRRLALARLLVVSRPIWLLDEPTSALDAAGESLLLQVMEEHLDGGGMIVAATHQPLSLSRQQTLKLEVGA